MKTQHTPGPWIVSEEPGGCVIVTDREYGLIVAYVSSRLDGKANKRRWLEQTANGHLIAAAPNLLTALKDALALLEYMAADRESAKQHTTLVGARAAIAQAEGTP